MGKKFTDWSSATNQIIFGLISTELSLPNKNKAKTKIIIFFIIKTLNLFNQNNQIK
tara:strand:+ start:997 stop:1164 length:168 start_codon:yes stop_codon:yes gene_type:complete